MLHTAALWNHIVWKWQKIWACELSQNNWLLNCILYVFMYIFLIYIVIHHAANEKYQSPYCNSDNKDDSDSVSSQQTVRDIRQTDSKSSLANWLVQKISEFHSVRLLNVGCKRPTAPSNCPPRSPPRSKSNTQPQMWFLINAGAGDDRRDLVHERPATLSSSLSNGGGDKSSLPSSSALLEQINHSRCKTQQQTVWTEGTGGSSWHWNYSLHVGSICAAPESVCWRGSVWVKRRERGGAPERGCCQGVPLPLKGYIKQKGGEMLPWSLWDNLTLAGPTDPTGSCWQVLGRTGSQLMASLCLLD